MTKYFMFIGSFDHLSKAAKGGFIQQKTRRTDKLSKGDKIVLYASKVNFEDNVPYRKVIAVGEVTDDKTFTRKIDGDTYYRRKVKYYKSFKPKDFHKYVQKLNFIKNKKYFGLYLISGFREINKHDFKVFKG